MNTKSRTQWKEKVTNAFGKGAQSYDQNNEIQLKVAKHFASLLPTKTKPKILEIGCGTGILTRHLIKKYPDASFDITDISIEMLQKAKQQLPENCALNFKTMDGENPCTEKKYDLIVSSMAFQWFENKSQSVLNLSSLLHNNGQLLYAVPTHKSFSEWQSTLLALNIKTGLIEPNIWPGQTKLKSYTIDYENTLGFLRTLKAIGANTPPSGYNALSPKQLKKAIGINDGKHGGKTTWEIAFLQL